MAFPAENRVRRHWEEEMLGEYLTKFHPGARILTRVYLGPLGDTFTDPSLSEAERKMLGAAWRRWADAVVQEQGRLLVIEVALIPDPRDISLLETYLRLVDVTEEFHHLRAMPRQGILVWAVDDPFSRAHAIENGLEVRLYRPSFFAEYLATRRERERRASRTGLLEGEEAARRQIESSLQQEFIPGLEAPTESKKSP
jgi:hypothetical protein